MSAEAEFCDSRFPCGAYGETKEWGETDIFFNTVKFRRMKLDINVVVSKKRLYPILSITFNIKLSFSLPVSNSIILMFINFVFLSNSNV